jgi:hypothetical protein
MEQLRVGFLTSWNTRCGIAEYSRCLAGALQSRGDVELKVFGSRNIGVRAVREYEEYATPVFDVQRWNPDYAFEFNVGEVLANDLDVLHIQYSTLFYNRRRLVELMRFFPGVVALTYHDKVVSRAFPYDLVDLLYAHREDVGLGPRRLIPQGMNVCAPVIKTFGLGKSQDELLQEICDRHGWVLGKSYGEDQWLEHEELYSWLRDCDAIVLWYREDPTSGGSAAAPLAISTRRPVFVNDTEWFRDLPDQTATMRKVRDVEELEAALQQLFLDPYAEQRSWDHIAGRLMEDYRDALAERTAAAALGKKPRTLGSGLFALLDPKPPVKALAQVVPIGPLRHAAHWKRKRSRSLKWRAGR